eukprot:CAMPEP_0201520700 /NCGR_PEP_ID=MMETSP0161_2-20130828/12186_1 /ASSEMBLY_ACC=CAM_ASM_000251 /TAXON_ID=180227 /ORGANISM="Neoparamoeba aestuarina, Strain SoJaBio B1-5/56/2" /LENGTH=337 /DNA_ID=CAMNT_0047919169 /DNA_START=50 /DNA_END=1063 /DNA_ORIENTATION=+
MATNALEELKKHTTVVADTGDFDQLQEYLPQDATTNPSLILQAAKIEKYEKLVDEAVKFAKDKLGPDANMDDLVEATCDCCAVNFGCEILKIIPGRVSTEIDARMSFDTEATVKKGKELAALYEAKGISKDRILLKIASTWEGLQAAKQLEAEGYHVNLTLLFSLVQAHVAGEVKATLISPFAGRITDFYKNKEGRKENYPVAEDPGVKSVANIYTYMKKNGYATVVMGASFRTKDQVIGLAGCDLLTVSPTLLNQLKNSNEPVPRVLVEGGECPARLGRKAKAGGDTLLPEEPVDEATFRWLMNEDEMASFKLEEGIRRFAADLRKLEDIVRAKLA